MRVAALCLTAIVLSGCQTARVDRQREKDLLEAAFRCSATILLNAARKTNEAADMIAFAAYGACPTEWNAYAEARLGRQAFDPANVQAQRDAWLAAGTSMVVRIRAAQH